MISFLALFKLRPQPVGGICSNPAGRHGYGPALSSLGLDPIKLSTLGFDIRNVDPTKLAALGVDNEYLPYAAPRARVNPAKVKLDCKEFPGTYVQILSK